MKNVFWFDDAVSRDSAVEMWLDEQPPEFAVIARTWFQRMRDCGDDVREVMHDGCPTACVEGAAFAYVNVFRAHANVGFFHGVELPDASGLLEGTGRRMRHVKIRPGVDVDASALTALIDVAYADMKRRLAEERRNAALSVD